MSRAQLEADAGLSGQALRATWITFPEGDRNTFGLLHVRSIPTSLICEPHVSTARRSG